MEKTYKILKIVLLALCFVALLLGANRLYDQLGSRVQMDALVTQSTQAPQPDSGEPGNTEPGSTEPEKQAAPDFTVYDGDGNAHKLSDYRGKPVILNFWASWCGPCKSEMPDFDEKYQQYGDEIHFLMVNLTDGSRETVDTASAFLEKQGYTFPVYFDSDMDAAMKYGISAVPVTYLLDKDGYLVAWGQGALSAEALQSGIDMLLGE